MFSHKLCSLSLQQGRVLTTLGPDHGGDEGADDYGGCGVSLSNLKKNTYYPSIKWPPLDGNPQAIVI